MRTKDGWRRLAGRTLALGLAVAIGSTVFAPPPRAEGQEEQGGGSGAGWYGPRSPSWWLRLGTTGYAFKTQNAGEPELNHFGAYQSFDGALSGLARGKLSVRVSGRLADDLMLKDKTTNRGRLYMVQAEARPSPLFTARLGRQFLQEGSTSLTLDGLWVSFRPNRVWDARVWGGANAPLDRAFKLGSFDDDAALGARLSAAPSRYFRLSGSWAYRERGGRVAQRPIGLEGTAYPLRGLRLVGRATYDLEREMWNREEILGEWRFRTGWPTVAAQWIDRRPSIDASSYFARFDEIERARIGRTTIRYEHRTGFGAELEYMGAFVDTRTSTRIGGSVITPYGRVGYSARLGDSGEESAWFGNAAVRAAPWLKVEGGATFATYALLQDAPESEERDLTTLFARLRAKPRPGLGVILEWQHLENAVYSSDNRVLMGVDLTMGRGAQRFGLDRGGWFK